MLCFLLYLTSLTHIPRQPPSHVTDPSTAVCPPSDRSLFFSDVLGPAPSAIQSDGRAARHRRSHVLREQCRHPERVRWECGEWRRRERPFPTKIGTLALAVARKGEIHVEVVKALRNRVEPMLDAPLDVMAASAFPTMPASSTSAAAPVTTTTPRTTSPSMIPHQGCH